MTSTLRSPSAPTPNSSQARFLDRTSHPIRSVLPRLSVFPLTIHTERSISRPGAPTCLIHTSLKFTPSKMMHPPPLPIPPIRIPRRRNRPRLPPTLLPNPIIRREPPLGQPTRPQPPPPSQPVIRPLRLHLHLRLPPPHPGPRIIVAPVDDGLHDPPPPPALRPPVQPLRGRGPAVGRPLAVRRADGVRGAVRGAEDAPQGAVVGAELLHLGFCGGCGLDREGRGGRRGAAVLGEGGVGRWCWVWGEGGCKLLAVCGWSLPFAHGRLTCWLGFARAGGVFCRVGIVVWLILGQHRFVGGTGGNVHLP